MSLKRMNSNIYEEFISEVNSVHTLDVKKDRVQESTILKNKQPNASNKENNLISNLLKSKR